MPEYETADLETLRGRIAGTQLGVLFEHWSTRRQELGRIPAHSEIDPAAMKPALQNLLIVDYLGLLRPDRKAENRTQEIGQMANGLKRLAMRQHIQVMTLSQLSRAHLAREDKRPQQHDLRESGDVEQSADIIIGLYREEYFLERTEPKDQGSTEWQKWSEAMDAARNRAELLVLKNRHGRTGLVNSRFYGRFFRFECDEHETAA